MTDTSDYDYDLPPELVAQQPLATRSDARLLVVDRATGSLDHRHVRDLPEILRAGDCLVLNDTRVVPARLVGRRARTGGRWEGLFLSSDAAGLWRLLAHTRGKLAGGETIVLSSRDGAETVELELIDREPGGVWIARPRSALSTFELLERIGRVPLPCYIRDGEMTDADVERYQTVYARTPGSAAAPTAGLHFTDELLRQLATRGVAIERVTLHVGLGTFRPIKTASIEEHEMHSEWGAVDVATAARVNSVRSAGGRVIAVGTTSVRTLESAATEQGVRPWSGATSLYIRPGYEFRAVDGLLTNFHLPRSTLLVLVRTLGGDDLIRCAYDEAIGRRYRFYSYGDAMLIV